MATTARSELLRYAVVPLTVAGAMLLRWPLWPVLEDEFAFLFLWPAVIFCAWYGGLGPGLLATLLSVLAADFFLLEPRLSFAVARPADVVGTAVFTFVGAVISLLNDKLRRGRQQVERQARELLAQRELLHATLTSIGDAVITTDAEGKVTLLNPPAQALTGWTPEEAVGQPLGLVFRVVNEETRQPVENPAQRALRDGQVVGLANHTVLIAKDGQEWPVDDCAAPIRGERGTVSGTVLVFREISERKRAQAALRENEERFRGAFEYTNVAMVLTDLDHRFVRANAAFARLFGYSDADILQVSMADITHPDDLAESYARREGLQAGEIDYFQMEKRYLHKEGHVLWGLANVSLVRDARGQPLYYVGQVQDITERKQAEAALQEAARRKDEFLAMLAHELRNPLAPIKNALHVLRLSEGDPQAVEKARGMMERQVRHLARIVDDLLDVSRITRGRLALRPERLDLARVARVSAEDHRPAFEQAGLALDLELPELPVWVQGDPTRLAQVLGNLLQNAVKFTDRGGTVTVRVGIDEARQQAVLTVRDTGIGIEPDMLPRLFDAFAQADRSLDRSKGGLGLGLALVKGLTELHGGEVLASSAGRGRGAEFAVRLPLEPEPAALSAPPAAPRPAPRRLRVLVVEDSRDSADSLRVLLELFGHEAQVAYSGPEGVAAAQAWAPDIVLCDIGLPGLDGYGVARELRLHPTTARVRLVALTGYGSDEDRDRSRKAGFDVHLTKPADPDELQRHLLPQGA